MITSDQVKSIATSLGFDACGIVSIINVGAGLPRPIQKGAETALLQEETKRLKHWVAQGCHGEMKYLENFEERAKRFWGSFPDAKSIIVVGVNYYSGNGRHPERSQHAQGRLREGSRDPSQPSAAQDDTRSRGRVARYAWGRDYHRVIGKRLEEFREKLRKIIGQPFRAEICVDTKPLLERSLAQKAGLGFIGKQSQLLSPQFGPWLFLAELVTDLELEPDTPFVGSCGSCTICIDHCPTEAIRPEGGIDSRRCIAYLTIEHKGEIPEALQPLIGNWVFGCDICLQVCPFTAKSKETHWPELKAESGEGESLDLVKLFEIRSNRAYEKRFQGTALMRARRKQLLRNAAIVINNLSAKEALPIIEEGGSRP